MREYNEDGNIIYEGESLYSKRHGKGREYNNTGQLIFEGEYLYGNIWNGKKFGLSGGSREIKNGV